MRTTCSVALAVAVLASSLVGEDGEQDLAVGLQGSAHDFSGEEWTGGDMCIACHAGGPEDFPSEAPLWNPSAGFNRTFAEALRQPPGERRSSPGPGTLVCMCCHDGTMAKDMFGGLAPPVTPNVRHPVLVTAGHGASNHPVGVPYPNFDRWYRSMNLVLAEGKVVLPDGNVECVSCHDPHNNSGLPYMLVKPNERSALCLTCHIK